MKIKAEMFPGETETFKKMLCIQVCLWIPKTYPSSSENFIRKKIINLKRFSEIYYSKDAVS